SYESELVPIHREFQEFTSHGVWRLCSVSARFTGKLSEPFRTFVGRKAVKSRPCISPQLRTSKRTSIRISSRSFRSLHSTVNLAGLPPNSPVHFRTQRAQVDASAARDSCTLSYSIRYFTAHRRIVTIWNWRPNPDARRTL